MVQFDAVLKRRLELIMEVLKFKEGIYAKDGDRYHNFKVAARVVGTTPEKALKGMMLKHEVSVMDLIEHAEHNPEKLNEELIEEKIGDNINYLILLEGMLKERLAVKHCMGGIDIHLPVCKRCVEALKCLSIQLSKRVENKREIDEKVLNCFGEYSGVCNGGCETLPECKKINKRTELCFGEKCHKLPACLHCKRVGKCMEAANEREKNSNGN